MFLQSLEIQGRVIHALFLREMKTRFGANRMGFVWAFLEPALHVLMFVMIWTLFGKLGPQGISPMLYLITGIVPYLMFSNTVNKVMKATASNRALLIFPQIKLLDFVITRMLMEFATYSIVFIVFLCCMRFAGFEFSVNNPLNLIIDFISVVLLGGGIGLLATPFSSMFKMTDHVIKATIRLMYIGSGVFFSVNKMPPRAIEYVVWNPLLHIIQHVRSDFFAELTLNPAYGNMTYVAVLTAVLWVFGMVLFKRLFKYIIEE